MNDKIEAVKKDNKKLYLLIGGVLLGVVLIVVGVTLLLGSGDSNGNSGIGNPEKNIITPPLNPVEIASLEASATDDGVQIFNFYDPTQMMNLNGTSEEFQTIHTENNKMIENAANAANTLITNLLSTPSNQSVLESLPTENFPLDANGDPYDWRNYLNPDDFNKMSNTEVGYVNDTYTYFYNSDTKKVESIFVSIDVYGYTYVEDIKKEFQFSFSYTSKDGTLDQITEVNETHLQVF